MVLYTLKTIDYREYLRTIYNSTVMQFSLASSVETLLGNGKRYSIKVKKCL